MFYCGIVNLMPAIGPLITLGTSSRPVIVINSTEAVTDLLEKRSHFSCKPRWPMAELLGRQKNVGFQYYGERLKRSRRVLHNALNANIVGTTWAGLLESQSVALLRGFLRSPETFYIDVGGYVSEDARQNRRRLTRESGKERRSSCRPLHLRQKAGCTVHLNGEVGHASDRNRTAAMTMGGELLPRA